MSPRFTRVPQEGAGAGVGVGILRAGGDFLKIKIKQGAEFRFPSVLASWFQSFKDSLIVLVCWKILMPSQQISISCFLEDIDPIFNIFKSVFGGSSGFSDHAFSEMFEHIGLLKLCNFPNQFEK